MKDRVKIVLGRYANPQYLKWLLLLLGLIGMILGAGAPDAWGGPGSGGG